MEQMITKRNLLDKFSTHVQEILKFLARTNYQNTHSHSALYSIAKAREEEICNSQRVISLDRVRQSGIIEAVKGFPSFRILNEHSASVSQHDLGTYFYDRRYKPMEIFNEMKNILGVDYYYSLNYYNHTVHFNGITEQRTRNAISYFLCILPADAYPYYNDMLDFINPDKAEGIDEDMFGNLIKTDAVPQMLLEHFSDAGSPIPSTAKDCINQIQKMLNGNPIAQFLFFNKRLRNDSGVHATKSYIPKGENRQGIIKEMLYTYVGVVYAFLDRDGRIDIDPMDGVSTFSLYYDRVKEDLLTPGICEMTAEGQREVEPREEVPSSKVYELSRENTYYIQFRNGDPSRQIDSRYLLEPSPLCILKDGVPTFYRNRGEVSEKDRSSYTILAELEGIHDEQREQTRIQGKSEQRLERLEGFQEESLSQQRILAEKAEEQTKILAEKAEEQTRILGTIADGQEAIVGRLDNQSGEISDRVDVQISIQKKQGFLLKAILTIASILLLGMICYLIWGRTLQDAVPDLSPDQLVVKGDSLLKMKDYEQAGRHYRKALASYKVAVSNDNHACLRLSEMYYLGKGAYSMDSALHYARLVKSEQTGEGHGRYVLALLAKGQYAEADREIPLAVNPDDAYMKISESAYDLFNDSATPDKQSLDKAIESLQSSKRAESDLLLTTAYMDGITQNDDSLSRDIDKSIYVFAPDYAMAFQTLSRLQQTCPVSFMISGDLAKDFGFYDMAMNYYEKALQCGIEQAASPILLMSGFCSQACVQQHQDIIKQARGLSNNQQNIVARTRQSVVYRSKGSLKHAIETQESIIESLEKEKYDDFTTDIKVNKRRLVSLLLLAGDSTSQSRAIGMVSALEDSRDTLAIQWYLDAIGHVLKDDTNTVTIDSLVDLSADRGFLPAIATRLCSAAPDEMTEQEFKQLWEYGINVPESIYSRSSEIAYLIADLCVRRETFQVPSKDDSKPIFYRCLKHTPCEYRMQYLIGQFFDGIAHKQGETTIEKPSMDALNNIYEASQIGLKAALAHKQAEVARQFCLYGYLIQETMFNMHGKMSSPMDEFIPYSAGRIEHYLQSGGVIHDFMTYFYQPLAIPYSYYAMRE